jgi:RND family efflux transporter MFP subunit
MIRKYVIPALAVLGVIFAIRTVVTGSKPVVPAQPVATPSESPFPTFVAGSGIIEASTENIAIGTHIPGIVAERFVNQGDSVKRGDPLFKIDDRDLKSQLAVQKSVAQVTEAELNDQKAQLAMWESLTDKRAVSLDALTQKRNAVAIAEAKLAQAKTQVDATQTNLDRLTVLAPVDGQVLQANIHAGEYASAGSTPLLLLGEVFKLHVRVDVDENDAWRVKSGAKAIAYLRGNREIKTMLDFVRFEPYVVPKKSLTGDSTERVDTRVLQVIYHFDRGELPMYVGQQVDVFIEAPGHNEGGKS